jgi:hypothetical protein
LEEEDFFLKYNEEEVVKYAQQQRRSDIHPRIELDDEIDMLWMLTRKRTSNGRYCRKRRTTNNKMQLNQGLCISKANGKKKHKVWKLG